MKRRGTKHMGMKKGRGKTKIATMMGSPLGGRMKKRGRKSR